jgi:hypothetical protein
MAASGIPSVLALALQIRARSGFEAAVIDHTGIDIIAYHQASSPDATSCAVVHLDVSALELGIVELLYGFGTILRRPAAIERPFVGRAAVC